MSKEIQIKLANAIKAAQAQVQQNESGVKITQRSRSIDVYLANNTTERSSSKIN